MKKLINNPNDVVKEMIGGLLTAHPSYLRKLDNIDVIVRKDAPVEGKVGLVSGGGSGHELLMQDMWAMECWMRLAWCCLYFTYT